MNLIFWRFQAKLILLNCSKIEHLAFQQLIRKASWIIHKSLTFQRAKQWINRLATWEDKVTLFLALILNWSQTDWPFQVKSNEEIQTRHRENYLIHYKLWIFRIFLEMILAHSKLWRVNLRMQQWKNNTKVWRCLQKLKTYLRTCSAKRFPFTQGIMQQSKLNLFVCLKES